MHVPVDNEQRDYAVIPVGIVGGGLLGLSVALQWIYYLLDC